MMQSFSIRDLRERSGVLSREMEQGNLRVGTRHGHPLFISIPFTSELLALGVHRALAVKLFKEGNFSLGKSAKLAKMTMTEFIEHVSQLGIPIVDFSDEELDQEIAYLNS
jgi:predicted HTH domain antitoxin